MLCTTQISSTCQSDANIMVFENFSRLNKAIILASPQKLKLKLILSETETETCPDEGGTGTNNKHWYHVLNYGTDVCHSWEFRDHQV